MIDYVYIYITIYNVSYVFICIIMLWCWSPRLVQVNDKWGSTYGCWSIPHAATMTGMTGACQGSSPWEFLGSMKKSFRDSVMSSAKNGCWWIHILGKCWELPTAPVINRRSNTTINGVNYGFLMPWLLGHFEGEVPFACWSNRNHSNELLQEVHHFFLQQIQTSISAGEKLHKITCELFFMRIPVRK